MATSSPPDEGYFLVANKCGFCGSPTGQPVGVTAQVGSPFWAPSPSAVRALSLAVLALALALWRMVFLSPRLVNK